MYLFTFRNDSFKLNPLRDAKYVINEPSTFKTCPVENVPPSSINHSVSNNPQKTLTLPRTSARVFGRRGNDYVGFRLQDQLTVDGQHQLAHVDTGGRQDHRDDGVFLEHGHVHGRRHVSRVPVRRVFEVHVGRPPFRRAVDGPCTRKRSFKKKKNKIKIENRLLRFKAREKTRIR